MKKITKKIIPVLLVAVLCVPLFMREAIPARAVTTMGSLTQTDDTTTNTGFNLSGRDFGSGTTAISGAGNSASVVYNSTTATPVVRGTIPMTPVYQGGGNFVSLDMVSATTVFGAHQRRDDNFNYSIVFHKTVDGGASWTNVTAVPAGFTGGKSAVSLKALDANTIYISYVENGTTLKFVKSTDGGATWTTPGTIIGVSSPSESSIAVVDASTAYISYGDSGNLKFAKTINGGTNWTIVTADPASGVGRYSSIEALSASAIFISYYDQTNTKPKLAKSVNNGDTWTVSTIPDTAGTGAYSSLEVLDANNIFIAYERRYSPDGGDSFYYEARVAKTDNGGSSWSYSVADGGLNSPIYYHWSISLKVIDTMTFLLSNQDAVNYDLRFAKTTTGGTSWTASAIDTVGNVGGYSSIDAIDANTVFIGYSGSGRLKIASSGYAASSGTYTSGSIDLSGGADITSIALAKSAQGNKVNGVGANSQSQLGDGGTQTATTAATAVQGLSNVVAVAASGEDSYSYSLALLSDGTIKAWGYNGQGQLGDGTMTSPRATPVFVCSTGTDCQTNALNRLSGVVAIAVGAQHSLALLSDGTVKAWGANGNGRLGDGSQTQRSNPVSVSGISTAVAIAAGGAHSLAVLSDGTVKAWGANGNGQLGDGTQTQRLTPVFVCDTGTDCQTNEMNRIGKASVAAVSVAASSGSSSLNHSLALLSDGTIKAWGYNGQGQLGDGSQTQRLNPVSVSGIFTAVSISAGGTAGYAGGGGHSLAVLADGTVRAWGHNTTGQLGNDSIITSLTPVPVSGLSGIVTVAAGGKYGSGGTSYTYSLALKSDGTVWGWGFNGFGQLGDGTQTQRLTPVQATTVSDVTAITAGAYHSLFVSGGIRAEIAANNDNSTWTYKGVPIQAGRKDSGSLSTLLGTSNQYVRYRLTMNTHSGIVGAGVEEVVIYYPISTNFDFTLGVSPGSASLGLASMSANATVTATVQGAYDSLSPVDFTYAVSPVVANGPNVSFSPGACTPAGGTPACTTTMTVSRVASTPDGNYTVTIYGDNGTLMKQTTFAVTVLPPLDFDLSLTLSSGEVIRGFESVSYIDTVLTVQYLGGESEIVGITSNAPAGITFNPSPTACSPAPGSCQSTIRMSASGAVGVGDYSIIITGTSGTTGGTRTTTFTLRVRDPLDFSLSANPISGAVFQGNTTTSIITASYITGVAENVSFSTTLDHAPAAGAISISFSTGTCTLGPLQPSCAKTMTISTSSNVTPDVYVITVLGTSSITNTIKTTIYTLNVSGPFDFTMTYPVPPCASSTVCAGTAEQGTSSVISFDITSVSAAGENVTVSVNGLPTNTTATITYSPNPCTPYLGNPCAVTVAIFPATDAPIGTFSLNIEGRSSQQSHSISYSLTIVQGFTFDLTLNPSSGFAMKGGAALSVLVNVGLVTGVGKQVDLTVDIAPPGSGVAVSFPSGSSCIPNCQRQISFSAPISAITGAYAVTIRGTYGTQTQEEVFALTVADPFDFSLNLSGTQGSVLQGDTIQTVATVTWLSGGTGADTVSFTASVVPAPTTGTLGVDFSPPILTNVGELNSPQMSTITMNPSGDLISNSYRIVIMAMSGTTIKTQAYNLTVGTTLDFTLGVAPDNERVLQGSQSGSIALTATNTSPADQPGANTIAFTIGDSPTYTLPKGVTLIPDPISSCSLGPVVGATCSSSFVFAVDATGIDGTYNIPIMGTSGFVKRLIYFTLKIGPLNLITYASPDFYTDPHQRPQVEFSWNPSVVFAGDTVQLSASSSTVYVTGQPGVLAQTPVTAMNATSVWSGIGPVPALPEVSIVASSSGLLNATLQVSDATGTSCYTSDSSGNEPCACRVTSSDIGGGTLDKVSAPRPFFREVKP